VKDGQAVERPFARRPLRGEANSGIRRAGAITIRKGGRAVIACLLLGLLADQGAGSAVLGFGVCLLASLPVLFWLWMAVDCLAYEHDPSSRTPWLLVVLFGSWIGALFYFFLRRRVRKRGERPADIGAGSLGDPNAAMAPLLVGDAPANAMARPADLTWLWVLVAVLLVVPVLIVVLLVAASVLGFFLMASSAKGAADRAQLEAERTRQEMEAHAQEWAAESVVPPVPPRAIAPPERPDDPTFETLAAPLLPVEAAPGPPLAPEAAIAVGDELLAEWGGRWQLVTVIEEHRSGQVKIHWVGWDAAFDEVVDRSQLRHKPAAAAADE
jgi:hypothetical protein